MEIVEEEIVCMETNIFGNVRPIAYSEPPKRLAHTASQVGSSNVLSFVIDQQGISSYRKSMEAAKDKELTIEKSTFANVRLAACTRPPKRPAQTVGPIGPYDVLHFASD